MTRRISSWIMLFLLALFLPANLTWAEEKAQPNLAEARLTYIYGDRDVLNPELQRAWGLVTLIEFDGKRILFDTGGDPKILQNNMQLLGIDPKTLDLIVVSHHHWEMIGGIEHLLQLKPKLPIISTAMVIDLLREYDKDWDLQTLSGTKQITPNISLMNLRSKPRHGGPFGIDELHIVLKTKQGLVILQGCGHPEIVNIMQKSQAQTKEQRVYLISGGTRLLESGTLVKLPGGGKFGIPQPHPYTDEDINKIADELLEAAVQHIVPTHCTGERSEKIFAEKFGDKYINEKLGLVITLPPPLSSP